MKLNTATILTLVAGVGAGYFLRKKYGENDNAGKAVEDAPENSNIIGKASATSSGISCPDGQAWSWTCGHCEEITNTNCFPSGVTTNSKGDLVERRTPIRRRGSIRVGRSLL